MSSVIFPNTGLQVLSSIINFLGISLLSHCVSRRFHAEQLRTWADWKEIPWPRLCIMLTFVDSWAFLFSSGILTFGVGLETSIGTCMAGIYLCVFFYATSKLLVYCFLIEKVHLVWSPTAGSRRLQSKIYLLCAVTVGLYAVVIVVMVIGRVHLLRESDNLCIIGLKPYSSILLLGYDLYINIFLTSLFLWPLISSKMTSTKVRNVALRTLSASVVALTTSSVNMIVLFIMKGHQKGWICLGSCGADVIFNALALFWVTSSSQRSTVSLDMDRSESFRPARPPNTPMNTMPPVFSPGGDRMSNTGVYDYLPAGSADTKVVFSPSGDVSQSRVIHGRGQSVFKNMTGFMRSQTAAPECELQVVVSRKCQVDTDSPMQMSSVDEEEDVSPEKKGEV